MMMHAFVLSNLGRLDEATKVSDRCIAVAEEKNDAITLCSMLQNRGFLNFMLGRIDQLIVDFRRSIQTSREFGFPMLEALNIKDLGEVYFYLGQPDEAEPCAQRAAELYAMIQGEKSPRVAYSQVAIARIKAYRGDLDGARALVDAINEKQAQIRAESADAAPLPTDGQVLLDNVGLWCRGASDEEFDALLARARAVPLQSQDIVELMEFKALNAVRLGRHDEGLRLLEAALSEAEKNAQVVADRLRRQIERVAPRAAS
jgi:tetratricopeptide (TPR) repeat protein